MKTKNPNTLNKTAGSAMSHGKLATLAANLLCEGCSLSRSIKLTKTIVLSFLGLALVTAGLSVGITAVAKKGEVQPQSANTLALAKASNNSSVNKITLIKAGTGLDGEGGSDNTVLINNSAKWRVALNLSTGTTTVTMEFPNGNVIDSASVSSAAGCVDGSKLEKINGSYTNNKATCVIKADSPKSQSWDITDYVFGGNGQKLAPTKVTVNGQAYTGTIPSVTLKGKANYKTFLDIYGSNRPLMPGYASFGISVYIQAADKSAAPIGLEPLSDTVKLAVDMSSLPSDWKIAYTSGMGHINLEGLGDTANRILSRGNWTPIKSADGKRLELTVKNTAIGYRHFPTQSTHGQLRTNYWATYAYVTTYIYVPLKSLSANGQNYQLKTLDSVASTIDGAQTTQISGGSSVGMWLSSRIDGSGKFGTSGLGVVGRTDFWNPNVSVYPGEPYEATPVVAFVNTTDTPNTNVNSCMTWDSRYTEPDGDGTFKLASNNISGNFRAQYGVVSSDGVPNAKTDCGIVGDSKANFFNTMAEAKDYATKKGGYVNAIRFHGDKAAVGEYAIARYPLRIKSTAPVGTSVMHSFYVSTNEWQLADPLILRPVVVPGKIHPELKLSNNSTTSPNAKPNEIEHLTITPYAYAADTNVKAIVTLPADISPVDGSYKYNGNKLTPTSVVKNTDGTTTITLPLGTVGSKDAVNAKQPDITMDAVVSPTIVTPASKTITVVTSGDGTGGLEDFWKSRSATFSVSNTIVNYGYNMSQSSADLLPGDNQTYNFTSYSNPDKDSPNKSMTTLSMLPYNGDKNGTKNIKYSNVTVKLTDPKLNFDGLGGYYTTDPRVRNIDLNDHSAVNSFLSYKAAWHEVSLSDFNWGSDAITLPSNATAIKWVDTKAIKDRLLSFSLTINNVRATASDAKLATAINYVAVTGSSPIVNPVSQTADVAETKVDVSLDKALANLSREESGATGLLSTTNSVTAATNSASGYSLTMKAKAANSLINSSTSKHTIEASASAAPKSLATNTWGYALPGNTGEGFGSLADYTKPTSATTFAKVPSSTDDAVIIKHTANRPDQTTGDVTKVAYGVNLGDNNVAGTYKTEVVYTVTANPFE